MRKNLEYSDNKKRMYDQDRKIVSTIQVLLFKDIANSLNTSFEEVQQRVEVAVHNTNLTIRF